MTLTQKIAGLTPEQREKLGTVKDEAGLNAFIAENGIELTDEDKKEALAYFENGVTPMSDDDMEAVAGGTSKKDAEKQAKADGRTVPLPYRVPGSYSEQIGCNCYYEKRWARSRQFKSKSGGVDTYTYYDIKCYQCNRKVESADLYG